MFRPPSDLQRFAERVDSYIDFHDLETFGDEKVFISSLYDENFSDEMTLAAFKAELLKAHQAGLVVLSRADLLNAMDPELVKRSWLRDPLGADYHFVNRYDTRRAVRRSTGRDERTGRTAKENTMAKDMWTVEAGRSICFDGVEFISLQREGRTKPVAADGAANLIAELFNDEGVTPESLFDYQMDGDEEEDDDEIEEESHVLRETAHEGTVHSNNDVDMGSLVGFSSWREVLDAAAAEEPIFYKPPLDRRPIRMYIKDSHGKSPLNYSNNIIYEVKARTIKMWPPGSTGRGKNRTTDPFTADSGHLGRFMRPE